MKNVKRVVVELTRDRKEGLIELEKAKKELKVRDDNIKMVVEAKDKAVADLQHLLGRSRERRRLQCQSLEHPKLLMTSTHVISSLALKLPERKLQSISLI